MRTIEVVQGGGLVDVVLEGSVLATFRARDVAEAIRYAESQARLYRAQVVIVAELA